MFAEEASNAAHSGGQPLLIANASALRGFRSSQHATPSKAPIQGMATPGASMKQSQHSKLRAASNPMMGYPRPENPCTAEPLSDQTHFRSLSGLRGQRSPMLESLMEVEAEDDDTFEHLLDGLDKPYPRPPLYNHRELSLKRDFQSLEDDFEEGGWPSIRTAQIRQGELCLDMPMHGEVDPSVPHRSQGRREDDAAMAGYSFGNTHRKGSHNLGSDSLQEDCSGEDSSEDRHSSLIPSVSQMETGLWTPSPVGKRPAKPLPQAELAPCKPLQAREAYAPKVLSRDGGLPQASKFYKEYPHQMSHVYQGKEGSEHEKPSRDRLLPRSREGLRAPPEKPHVQTPPCRSVCGSVASLLPAAQTPEPSPRISAQEAKTAALGQGNSDAPSADEATPYSSVFDFL